MSKEIQFEKSFASNEKSKYWSNKNKLKPNDVSKSSNKKYLFNCNLCNHEFESSLNDIVSGSWCSYCDNHSKKLCVLKNLLLHIINFFVGVLKINLNQERFLKNPKKYIYLSVISVIILLKVD